VGQISGRLLAARGALGRFAVVFKLDPAFLLAGARPSFYFLSDNVVHVVLQRSTVSELR